MATGTILAFDRLTVGVVAAPYAITLAVKSALSVWMFLLVRDRRRQYRALEPYRQQSTKARGALGRLAESLSGYNGVVVLGVVIFFLSDLLKVLFELALSRG